MEDPIFKREYQKHKNKVKIWEKSFKLKYGRPPSKHDIKDSAKDIRYSYHRYYVLKTTLLENTLSDVLTDEDFNCSMDVTQSDTTSQDFEMSTDSNFSNLSELKTANISISSLLTDQIKGDVREFQAVAEEKMNENAWGEHLNIKKPVEPVKEPELKLSPPIRSNLRTKLMSSYSFSKRNPRKPLPSRSGNVSSSSSLSTSSLKSSLPDLETVLIQKYKEMEEPPAGISKLPGMSDNRKIVNDVDTGWLNRCGVAGNRIHPNISHQSSSTNESDSSKRFGLKNINVSAIMAQNSTLSSTALSDSSSFGMSALAVTSSSLNSSNDTTGTSYIENTYDKCRASDSDEVVENSEDEIAEKQRTIRHVIKKRRVFTEINKNVEKQSEEAKETSIEIPEITDETPKDEKPKNVKPAKKVVAKILPKKTLRKAKKPVSYKIKESDEEDCDDSDKDPDYKENKLLEEIDKQIEEDGNIEKVSPEPKKRTRKTIQPKIKKSPKTKKSVSTKIENNNDVKKSPKSKKSVLKKIVAPRIGLGKLKKKASNLLKSRRSKTPIEEEPQKNEEFNQYVLEFGIESMNNAPRINIKELEKNTKEFSKFVNSGSSGTAKAANSDYVAPKSAKMAALEKRIKAGTLNENYVQVDLKKKVFVRGHTKMNFSRYKKNLWKKKKASALSGPDMDMGGCDGGVLTCFICGGVGHFARQCKVKGDNLLPENAEVDDSPFPTLEEAENMAKEKALLAHASRPQSLPAVANQAWKEGSEDSQNCEKMDESEEKIDQNEEKSDQIEEDDEEYELNDEEMMEVAQIEEKKSYIGHVIPEEFLKRSGILEMTVGNKDKIGPLYSLNEDGSLPPTPPEVFEALKMFGHESFRSGQEKAVMRVLCGMSTLVTLSTGSGKSLCYQLPSYLYRKQRRCVTLVISPLVSLMEDQVHGVPDFLNAQCLHTNQTPKVRERIMQAIQDGELDVLLISPEAVVSGEKSTGFGSLLRQLPPIAFACIDEAHCVSQWSHNFRPSYLMICRVLKEKLGVHTILGLTATATVQTRQSIIEHLAIPDGINGIISDIPLPDNLILTVSKDPNRDTSLLTLLRSERFSTLQSIIIYCTRRDECERISSLIRTCLQDNKPSEVATSKNKKRKRMNYNAEPYHAGLPSSRRKSIQNAFMGGDLRIVVATIAFGMGINKADIRAIIHYNMPKNFESYVQEVGRAGRDGKISHCHLFLESKGNDRNELRRHIYANSIDRHVIRKLLQKIFVPCACSQNFRDKKFVAEHQKNVDALKDISWSETESAPQVRVCPGHEVCFSIEATVQQLDIPAENISTLLCYLELHEQRFIQVLSKAYVMCKVMSYAGPKGLKLAAKECPPLAMAIALDLKNKKSHDESTIIEFPVIDVAAAIGWDSGVVKYQLKNLEWTTVNGFKKRSAISVTFYDLGFRIRAPGDLADEELDTTLDTLFERVSSQEKAQLLQLQSVFDALSSVAFPTVNPCLHENCPTGPSEKLKKIVRQYFQTAEISANMELPVEVDETSEDQLVSDIRTMIYRYPDNNFTGRTIARIFHGVQSPNYPAVIWGRCNYWRGHTKSDFNRIVKIANKEIVKMRS